MPIVDGKYKSPNWNNNAPPAITAEEMNAISNTLEEIDHGKSIDTQYVEIIPIAKWGAGYGTPQSYPAYGQPGYVGSWTAMLPNEISFSETDFLRISICYYGLRTVGITNPYTVSADVYLITDNAPNGLILGSKYQTTVDDNPTTPDVIRETVEFSKIPYGISEISTTYGYVPRLGSTELSYRGPWEVTQIISTSFDAVNTIKGIKIQRQNLSYVFKTFGVYAIFETRRKGV